MPVGRELSPVYIFNNIVLKQVRLVWVQRSKRKLNIGILWAEAHTQLHGGTEQEEHQEVS